MFKKLLITVTVMALTVGVVGCANKTPDQPQTPAPNQSSLESHPAETPVAPNNGEVKEDQASVEKKVNTLVDKNYPGEWKVSGKTLSKGQYTENDNYKIVDEVANLFPGNMGVSIFIGKERISTSIKMGDQRALSYQGSGTETVEAVMNSGKTTSTESSGYLKVYIPLKAGDKTLAVMTVSTPKQ